MKKILFPTDFSENAMNALRYTAQLAQEADAELIILHAMHIPAIDGNTPVDSSAEIIEEQKNLCKAKLDDLANVVKREAGIEPTVITDFGFAVDLICGTAKELNVDLVAMGTKGAGNILEQLLGSVTAGVAKKSTRPVMAIPVGTKFSTPKIAAFATDLSDNDAEVIRAFSDLLDHFEPELHVVHVEVNEKLAQLQGHHLITKVVDEYDRIKRVELKADDVEHALEEYVIRDKVDIMAVKRHNRGFFQNLFHNSITTKMAYHTHVPLVIYHD